MKKTSLIIIGIILAQHINAQTYISDQQEVYGTWKKSGSPYIVDGEAIVPAGKTLVIKKGVTVKFRTGTYREYRDGDYKSNEFDLGFLRVKGTIIAKGSPTDKIKFTANGEGYWGNIFVNSMSSKNMFSYCVFEKAYYIRGITHDDNATGALTFLNATGTVSNCMFIRNGWTALNFKQSSSPTVTNVTIVKNNYGIECNSNSNPIIKNTIIWKNYNGLYINGNSLPKISYSLLQDSYIQPELDKGNNIFAQDPDFKDEIFDDYSLKPNSLCKKAGANEADMGSK